MNRFVSTLIIFVFMAFTAVMFQNCGQQEFSQIAKSNKLGDVDSDGLQDIDEIQSCTIETNEDTDGDGLLDGEEVHVHGTNPCKADTDNGGTNDGDEVNQGTNPVDNPNDDVVDMPGDVDTDGDGLFDMKEDEIGTDKTNPDTDGDGLKDGREYNDLGTDPLKRDTDGGGINDHKEAVRRFTDPKNISDDDPDEGTCEIINNPSTSKDELICVGKYLFTPTVTFTKFALPKSEDVSGVFLISKVEKLEEPTMSCQIDDGAPFVCSEMDEFEYENLAIGKHKLTLLVIDDVLKTKDIFKYKFKVEAPAPIDGLWSPWNLDETGICGANCKRVDRYSRTCTPPQHGGAACVGDATRTEEVACSYGEGQCKAPANLVRVSGDGSFPTRFNVDSSTSRMITFENQGGQSASDVQVSVSSGDFVIVSNTCGPNKTIAVGGTCKVEVNFVTSDIKSSSGSLNLDYLSNSEDRAQVQVALSGVAQFRPFDGVWRITAPQACSNSCGQRAVTKTGSVVCEGHCNPATKPNAPSIACPATRACPVVRAKPPRLCWWSDTPHIKVPCSGWCGITGNMTKSGRHERSRVGSRGFKYKHGSGKIMNRWVTCHDNW